MATLEGLYSASVLDNKDPEGLGRVRVRVATLEDVTGARGVWARVATMMAGRNRGTLFMPDVGDEVLVAFDSGDQRAPYVLGALWNAKSAPPAEASDPATVKLIRSRTGVTLRIRDDDATGSLVIETPGGQRITLQDGPGSVRVEDANGNSVTMQTSGVTVTASGTVTLTASNVTVSAGAITVNAGMSRFTGVVQCDTMISNAVVSASYTPGAGNLW
jgi:uncharacterized protein involved in type VI secretion and phage assembly